MISARTDASSSTKPASCSSSKPRPCTRRRALDRPRSRKQVAVATAQILFQRFWFVSSMKQFGVGVRIRDAVAPAVALMMFAQDSGMGALYLASKLEECPIRMRDLVNVYDLLAQRAAHAVAAGHADRRPGGAFEYTPMSYFSSTFYELKDALVVAEMQLLKRLGFQVNVVLPYGTLVNYMQLLNLASEDDMCSCAWGYLNDA
jgi:hypothetical protein